jgi:hypothetical protein
VTAVQTTRILPQHHLLLAIVVLNSKDNNSSSHAKPITKSKPKKSHGSGDSLQSIIASALG